LDLGDRAHGLGSSSTKGRSDKEHDGEEAGPGGGSLGIIGGGHELTLGLDRRTIIHRLKAAELTVRRFSALSQQKALKCALSQFNGIGHSIHSKHRKLLTDGSFQF
jgi:hypothetical protein